VNAITRTLAEVIATARETLAICERQGWPFAAPKQEGK
jgi:hypothetical protein